MAPDGLSVLLVSGQVYQLVQLAPGMLAESKQFSNRQAPTAVAYSARGDICISQPGVKTGTILYLTSNRDAKLRQVATDLSQARAIGFLTPTQIFLQQERILSRFDFDTERHSLPWEFPGPILAVQISPSQRWLAVSIAKDRVYLFRLTPTP